ncbi:MAG: SDR family oxidoreductase [Paracoccaceae bacterium]
MQVDLSDKIIVVTGAASGIGLAIARQAASSGAGGLLLTDRDAAGLAKVKDELGPQVQTVVADLADFATPAAIAQAALQRFGRIDGLVNAAGLTTRASFLNGSPEVWDALFAVNTRAPFFLMQAAIVDMRARSAAGAIVNITSVNAHCGIPALAIYSATKGALVTMTKNAANAHMADRIRVNAINLGWVPTEGEHRMQGEILGRGPGWLAEEAVKMPLGRLVEAAEAARLAVFLLADISVPMSGTVTDFEQKVAGLV